MPLSRKTCASSLRARGLHLLERLQDGGLPAARRPKNNAQARQVLLLRVGGGWKGGSTVRPYSRGVRKLGWHDFLAAYGLRRKRKPLRPSCQEPAGQHPRSLCRLSGLSCHRRGRVARGLKRQGSGAARRLASASGSRSAPPPEPACSGRGRRLAACPPKVSKTVLGTFRLGCLWTSQLRAVRSQSVAVPKRLLQRASGAHVDPRPHFLSLRLSCRNRRCLHPCCKIQAWAASAAHDKATGHRLFPESLIWPEHQLALIKITSLLRGSQTQSGASHEARPTSSDCRPLRITKSVAMTIAVALLDTVMGPLWAQAPSLACSHHDLPKPLSPRATHDEARTTPD